MSQDVGDTARSPLALRNMGWLRTPVGRARQVATVILSFTSLVVVVFVVAPARAGGPSDGSAAVDPRIDEILTRLERRSDGLSDIRCKVHLVEDDRINLSKRTKRGELLFLMTKPNAHFLISFDRTEMDGVLGKREWYLFDGRWLYQALERLAQVTKQEIARPGESIDLFDLERAPFPPPFGQKKKSILKNFDVTLVPPARDDPQDTDHLACVPKASSPLRRKYEKLDLYIRRDIHLPGRIVITRGDGLEITTADFPDLSAGSLNTGVTVKAFTRPKAWKKYTEVVEELVDRPTGNP